MTVTIDAPTWFVDMEMSHGKTPTPTKSPTSPIDNTVLLELPSNTDIMEDTEAHAVINLMSVNLKVCCHYYKIITTQ